MSTQEGTSSCRSCWGPSTNLAQGDGDPLPQLLQLLRSNIFEKHGIRRGNWL